MENKLGTNEQGKFYVVGVGPAGPQTATLQALDILKRMDAIVAAERHVQLFAEYVGEKPVLFDPWEGFWDCNGRPIADLSAEEAAEFHIKRFGLRDERVRKIKEFLQRGKDVALLDSGNPCFFGPGHWYVEQFAAGEIVIIPGMGCEAAALAALGKSIIPAYDVSFVLQTASLYLQDMEKVCEDLLQLKVVGEQLQSRRPGEQLQFSVPGDLPQIPVNMVMYMIYRDYQKLFASLAKFYPADTPCAVVYWAGYPDEQRVVRGTVADMASKIAGEEENKMGLLFVGRFLEGKPYEAAMRASNRSVQQQTSAGPR